MAFDPKQIHTIAILMFENRSFDHLFGHLSLAGYPVDGLRGPIDPSGRVKNDAYANEFEGTPYYPFQMADGRLPADLPHGRQSIETDQLAANPVTGKATMRGFVRAYYTPTNPNRTQSPEPMGFLREEDVPVSSFLAREYAVCDRWFSCVPADTQANRLMALSGFTRIDHIGTPPILPHQATFLDWLTDRNISWRVYRNGLSFLTLMPQFLDDIVADRNFRSVSHLAGDVANEPDATFPKVLVIEPSYSDAPLALEDPPNDNHAPLAVAPGEAYLKRIYEALSAGPRWKNTLFVVTYDEHGGFFDHVPPPRVASPVPSGANYTAAFKSAGVRVPGLVISPFVPRGTVFSGLLDHTSILQLLADTFAPGGPGYSPEVNSRRAAGVNSVSAVVNTDVSRPDVPPTPGPPPAPPGLAAIAPQPAGPNMMRQAFAQAAIRLGAKPGADLTHPGIQEWSRTG